MTAFAELLDPFPGNVDFLLKIVGISAFLVLCSAETLLIYKYLLCKSVVSPNQTR